MLLMSYVPILLVLAKGFIRSLGIARWVKFY
jgi:hypothetical protein